MPEDKNIFITSHNQMGGVTAHTVNFGPTARSMNHQLGAQLMQQVPASASVRAKLAAANPNAAAAIKEMVAEIAGDINRKVRDCSIEHIRAKKEAKRRHKLCQLTEADVHARARSQDFEKTVVALSLYGRFPVELVERALLDEGADMALILAKAAGCSRTTARAILLMQAAGRGMSAPDLDKALASFDRLGVETARRVLDFYEQRRKSRADMDISIVPASPGAASTLRTGT